MQNQLSQDTRRRITGHLVNLASPDEATATQAELRLLGFGKKATGHLLGLEFGSTHQANGYAFANAKDPDGNSVSISSRAFRATAPA